MAPPRHTPLLRPHPQNTPRHNPLPLPLPLPVLILVLLLCSSFPSLLQPPQASAQDTPLDQSQGSSLNTGEDPASQDEPMSSSSSGGSQGQAQLRLGFLMPFPVGDSAIPPRVADEWMSATKLAMNVLAPSYEKLFYVQYYIRNSNCSRESAEQAAQELVADGVHAVVGPACSEAAVGADTVLRVNNIPFISFAATATAFSAQKFATMFRTAFTDDYQGKAIAAMVKQYGLTNLNVFYSDEIYGRGLISSIQTALLNAGMNVPAVPITVPHPPPSTPEAYQALFSPAGRDLTSNASTGIVLATSPNVAQGLLDAAMNLGKIQYPWWYIGADGAVTFDLVGEGQNMALLASAIQGELGVGPYDGVDDSGTPEPQFAQFYNYWVEQQYTEYPGLLTLPSSPRTTRPRAYVVNLIDAIWAFHEAARILLESSHTLTRGNILQCLRGSAPCSSSSSSGGSPVVFQGASGWVAFNSTTGDRLAFPSPPAPASENPIMYQVQNLIGLTWQYKGSWKAGQDTGLGGANALEVTRPGPIPANATVLPYTAQAQAYVPPEDLLAYATAQGAQASLTTGSTASTSTYSGGMSAGTIAALVLLSTILMLLAIGGIIYWQRNRRPDTSQFSRMM